MESYLEEILKNHFQRQFEFELDGKIFKRGRLVLFRIDLKSNNYDVLWMFKTSSEKLENFRTPIPYDVEYYPDESEIFFDYRIKTLVKGNTGLSNKLKKLASKYSPSKYFDSIVTIRYT